MNLLRFLLSLLLASALGAADRPNVLMILVDDLGVKDIGIGGSTLYRTPHIDQLGSEGMVFENAYAAHPRCVPSRYGIFSGRLPGRDGVPGYEDRKASKHTLPLSRVTFAEHLREAGYATGYIGKWHLGKKGGEPDKQGFGDSRIAGEAGAPNSYFWPYHQSTKPWHKEVFPEVEGTKGEYLTSDHGGLSTRGAESQRPLATTNAPYRHGKGWLYEGGVRVPMIVRWPDRVKAGSKTTARNFGVDHYPTILEAAGVNLPAAGEIDGMSYLPVLKGGELDRGPLFFHSPRGRPQSTGDDNASALISGKWKVYEHHEAGAIELYNLESDPGEQHDLAKENPDELAELSAALHARKKALGTRQGGKNPFDKRKNP